MCALHVSPAPALRGNSAAAPYSRPRPDQFRPIQTQQVSPEPILKRRKMSSPDHQGFVHPGMRSYPSNPIPSRAVQYSGSYPVVKPEVQDRHQQYAPHRSFEAYQAKRYAPPPQHAKASLPGLSSLLQSSGSPPQRPLDAPPINVSLANVAPRYQRTVSWSSNGSPIESPLVSHSLRRAQWDERVARDQHVRDVYGQYYAHQQHVSQPYYRSQMQSKSPLGGSASPGSLSGDDAQAPPGGAKNSRYLREMDRRAILERLANGEKQAALAKEFQVSRAAICNLNKHREEVMSRSDENPFAKHPKKRKVRPLVKAPSPQQHEADSADGEPTTPATTAETEETSSSPMMTAVHVVQSRAVQLLLTTLRSHSTPLGEFRRCSERVMRLVIEDALALVPTKPVDVFLNDQVKVEGVGMKHAPCGISMEQRHCPMMDMFHLIEPDQPTGYVRLGADPAAVTLLDAHLPQALRFYNVFLFDLVAASSETICATIQQLKDRGALESMVHVVALFVSSEVVASVQCTFPSVQIITAQIDASLNKKNQRGSGIDTMLARFAQVYDDSV